MGNAGCSCKSVHAPDSHPAPSPLLSSPFSCPQRELGSILSSQWDEFIIFYGVSSLYSFIQRPSSGLLSSPVPWKGGVGAGGLGHLSSPVDLPHFSLFFSRNKQGLMCNLLHAYGKYKPKLGMLE